MAGHICQKKHHLTLINIEVISKVPAEIQRGQDTMAKPVLTGTQGLRGKHRLLHLTTRGLVLLKNTQRVAELSISPR